MKLSQEEKELILEKRRHEAERECPEIPLEVLRDIITKAESGPAIRDGGLTIKRSIARQAAVWGFMQKAE